MPPTYHLLWEPETTIEYFPVLPHEKQNLQPGGENGVVRYR